MSSVPASHPYATVRIASPSDLDGIRAVADETWRATYHGILSDSTIDAFLKRSYSDYSLLATLNAGGLWVLEQDGRVVGYERLSVRDEVGYVGAIYVLPEAQGHGHGRRLWEGAKLWFAARRVREVRLTVAEGNERARGFYRHLGFQEGDVRRSTLLGEPLDERHCSMTLLQDYLF